MPKIGPYIKLKLFKNFKTLGKKEILEKYENNRNLDRNFENTANFPSKF